MKAQLLLLSFAALFKGALACASAPGSNDEKKNATNPPKLSIKIDTESAAEQTDSSSAVLTDLQNAPFAQLDPQTFQAINKMMQGSQGHVVLIQASAGYAVHNEDHPIETAIKEPISYETFYALNITTPQGYKSHIFPGYKRFAFETAAAQSAAANP